MILPINDIQGIVQGIVCTILNEVMNSMLWIWYWAQFLIPIQILVLVIECLAYASEINFRNANLSHE